MPAIMRGIGCLVFSGIVVALLVEGWVVDLVAHGLGAVLGMSHPEYLLALVAMAAASFIGWRLLRLRLARLPLAMMAGDIGRPAVAIVGSALLAFPGFISGLLGLLMQIPIVQGLFASLAGRLMMGLMRRASGRMGMPGGFPGAGAFPGGFPGMGTPPPPPTPDQRHRGGRTFDVTNER